MDKRSTPAVTVGGTSLLTVFAVLCLTVFALLSIATARSNQRLADPARQSVEDYYAADALAQTILARLRNGETVEGVTQDGDTCTYACPIGDTARLEVTVRLQGSDYEILRYQTVPTGPWKADDTLPVWEGQ